MKALAIASSVVLALATASIAQTADKKIIPGDAPTKSMDAATPETKGPGTGEHPPTGRIDQVLPPMSSGDASAGVETDEFEGTWRVAELGGKGFRDHARR